MAKPEYTLALCGLAVLAFAALAKADCKYVRSGPDAILMSDDRYGTALITQAQFNTVLRIVIQKYVEYNGTTSAEVDPRVMPRAEMQVWVDRTIDEHALQRRDWWWFGDLALILYRKTEFNGATNAALRRAQRYLPRSEWVLP